MQVLDHHASLILPYEDREDELYLFLERKSQDYFPPHFNGALCIMGGNSTAEDERDGSPLDTAILELQDDFALQRRHVPQPLGMKPPGELPLTRAERTELSALCILLTSKLEHVHDYVVSVRLGSALSTTFGCTLFGRRLEASESSPFRRALDQCGGSLTVHNRVYRSSTECLPLGTALRERWAWGYDKLLAHLLTMKRLPGRAPKHTMHDSQTTVRPLQWNRTPGPAGPRYDDMRRAGFSYASDAKR